MMNYITVSSGYGGNTQKPFVMMESEELDTPIQMDPATARELALNLLQCADAAESDGFIVEFMKKELKADDRHTIVLLREFRKFREQSRKAD